METRKYGSVAQIFRLRHGHGAEGRLKILSQGGLPTAVPLRVRKIAQCLSACPVCEVNLPGPDAAELWSAVVCTPI